MKRHALKFLLSLVRALVFLKRFFVWLGRIIGHLFAWVFQPTVPYLIVPAYALVRRLARQYRELSPHPWERRKRVVTSQLGATTIFAVFVFLTTRVAVAASMRPGLIAGSRSILLAKIIPSDQSDWQIDTTTAEQTSSDEVSTSPVPTVVYRTGGGIAYVFPYGGAVGAAPAQPSQAAHPDQRKPIQKYAIQRGDTLAHIAQKFNLKIATLLWANNITERTTLRPGDTLTVPAVDGVVYVVKHGGTSADVARVFGVDAKKVASANGVSLGASFQAGASVVVPDAQPPAQAPQKIARVQQETPPAPQPAPAPPEQTQPQDQSPPNDTSNGADQSGQSENIPPEQPPAAGEPPVVARPQLQPGEKLLWPTVKHGINQYFSSYHPGIDIAGDYTDPIYAADDGTVVQSGWNDSGYGNMILIDHGNGIRTRYGHASKVFVHVGQEVSRGDVIGMVGTTGRSTGTHLHFETIVNGKRVNPFKYVR